MHNLRIYLGSSWLCIVPLEHILRDSYTDAIYPRALKRIGTPRRV